MEGDFEGKESHRNAVLDSLWSGKWKRKETLQLQLKSNADRSCSAFRTSGASSSTLKPMGKLIAPESARASPSPPVDADPRPQPPPLMATALVDDRHDDDPFGLKSIHHAKSPDEDGAGTSVVRQAARGGRGGASAVAAAGARGSTMSGYRGVTRGCRGSFMDYELPPRFRRPRIAQEQASAPAPSAARVESSSPFSAASEGPDIQETINFASMMLVSAVAISCRE